MLQRLAVAELQRHALVDDPPQALAAALCHALGAAGKGLRPILLLEAARLGPSPSTARVRRAAVAVELMHTATLTHDDIIDRASVRRGRASVAVADGPRTAALTGVWLASRVIDLMADCGDTALHRCQETVDRMCVGQMLELGDLFDTARTRERYYDAIAGKTAALFELAARLGAQLADADDDTVDRLTRYGHHLGLAFQIADDILDITADHTTTGKQRGTDIRQGVFTLPVIYALETNPDIQTLVLQPHATDTALDAINATDGPARALDECHRHTTTARDTLPPQQTLSLLGDAIVERCTGALR